MLLKMVTCLNFEKRSKKNDMPIGAALMNGIVASVVIVLAPILPNQDLFWAFSP